MSVNFSRKQAAYKLFIERKWTVEQITELLNLDTDQVADWIERGKWEKQKETIKTSRKSTLILIQNAYQKFLLKHSDTNNYEEMLKGIKTFTEAIEKAKKGEATPAAAQEIMVRFSRYLEAQLKGESADFDALIDYQHSFLEVHNYL